MAIASMVTTANLITATASKSEADRLAEAKGAARATAQPLLQHHALRGADGLSAGSGRRATAVMAIIAKPDTTITQRLASGNLENPLEAARGRDQGARARFGVRRYPPCDLEAQRAPSEALERYRA